MIRSRAIHREHAIAHTPTRTGTFLSLFESSEPIAKTSALTRVDMSGVRDAFRNVDHVEKGRVGREHRAGLEHAIDWRCFRSP
jgi:hypothetical protein